MKGEHKEKVAFIIVSFMAVNERKQTNNAGDEYVLQKAQQQYTDNVIWKGHVQNKIQEG